MRGDSPAWRSSATITLIPRHARSMASVNPTGPAPTISTWVWIVRYILTSNGWHPQARGRWLLRQLVADQFHHRHHPGTPQLDCCGEFPWRAAARGLAGGRESIGKDGIG